MADKLSELVVVNVSKEKEIIDNGDVGSTKDYPSDNEQDYANDMKIGDMNK